MGPLLHEQHLPAQELIALIRSLADQVVQSRLDHTDPDTLQAEAVLAQSAPVFASLYGLTRATQLDAKESRARTQDARLEMDAAHLRLQVRFPRLSWPPNGSRARHPVLNPPHAQNLLFQRNHIEREIRAAEEYS